MNQRILSFAVLLHVTLSLFVVRTAAAADAVRLAVYFEGKGADVARDDVVSAVSQDVTVVDEDKSAAAIKKVGLKGKVRTLLSKESSRESVSKKLESAAKACNADAFLLGSAPDKGGAREISVMVVKPGAPVTFDTIALEAKETQTTRHSKWGAFLDVAFPKAAPAEPEPAAEPEPTPEADATSEVEKDETPPPAKEAAPAPHSVGHAIVIAGLGLENSFRSMSYNDPFSRNLRPYSVSARPGVRVDLELYPLARSNVAVVKDLALTGSFSQVLPFDSETDKTGTVGTSWQRYEIGIKGRIRTGKSDSAPLLGLGASYAHSQLSFGDTAVIPSSELPGARYGMLRAQVDARIPVSAFALLLGASYLHVLDAQPMNDRFPNERVQGVGAHVGGAYRVLPWLEARLDARYDRIFSSLRPTPGDSYVAGGALDQYLSLNLGGAAIF